MTVLRNIFLIILLIGVVFMVSHYAEPVKTMALSMVNLQDDAVLGASSSRADEITQKVSSDVGREFAKIQQQALEVTLGDIVTTISRVQKIPHDIDAMREFIVEQADNVLQSTK